MLNIFLTIISIILVFFLPGLVLSLLFFTRNEIEILERMALSIGLSIAVVPMIVFYGNLIGIKITKFSVIMEILALLSVVGGILVFKDYKNNR
jgi:uncharacterized membrane protein